ncbi:MAG: ankyrin repeat domain-containing protein [Amoebophilaceae bacterium]|nr:ankyrin repeat domain-containing protein [Amoebophilaceae bacterium]
MSGGSSGKPPSSGGEVQKLPPKLPETPKTPNNPRLELYQAALNSDKAALQAIVKGIGQGPDDSNTLPDIAKHPEKLLVLAIFEGHQEAVDMLLKEQTINAALEKQKNDAGKTMLHMVVEQKKECTKLADVLAVILTFGINMNAKETNEQCTALHLAACDGHEQVVELLLNHGATVDKQDNRNNTALHYATRVGNEEIVNMLLDKHAKVNKINAAGDTAFHIGHFFLLGGAFRP